MKPILFNTDMVRALLEGRKTVTRRVIDRDIVNRFDVESDGTVISYEDPETGDHYEPTAVCRYQPGDVLYVQETFCSSSSLMGGDWVCYKADVEPWQEVSRYNWKPSIHMPREFARLFLRVKSVNVQQLRQITDEEAVREGARRMFDYMTDKEYEEWAGRIGEQRTKEEWGWENYLWHGNIGENGITRKMSDSWQYQMSGYDRPRDSFSSLWNSLLPLKKWNECGWEANPYVWVIEFEKIGREESWK